MLLAELAATSVAVRDTSARSTKITLIAACLADAEPAEIEATVATCRETWDSGAPAWAMPPCAAGRRRQPSRPSMSPMSTAPSRTSPG